MPTEYHNYVGGEWVESETGNVIESQNPADTTEVVAHLQRSNAADTARAIDAANEAQSTWASTPAPERGAILRDAAARLASQKDALTEKLTREEGKTHAEARPEVQRAIDIFYYYAEKTREYRGTAKAAGGRRRDVRVVREPVGVAGLITPWNYPIAIPAWKLAPALATGNTVVLKPASQAATPALEIVSALDEAGIPDGVVNVVTGPGSTVGETITTHDGVDAVSFTGSGEVGTHVFEQASMDQKRVQTEMGGKNPTVVRPSADVDEAVEIAGAGAFGVTGQACTAGSRAIVDSAVYEEFVDGIVEYAESLTVGDGASGVDMGPQVSRSELEGTLEYVDVGTAEGATLATGGSRLTGDAYEDGYFVEPTVFTDVEPDMRVQQEEIFGPVLSVVEVDGYEEALEVANGTPYGLSASIVTDDHTEARRFADEVKAGVVKVNEKTTGLELNVPFGGFDASSSETYREQGDAGIDFYTIEKTIYTNY